MVVREPDVTLDCSDDEGVTRHVPEDYAETVRDRGDECIDGCTGSGDTPSLVENE